MPEAKKKGFFSLNCISSSGDLLTKIALNLNCGITEIDFHITVLSLQQACDNVLNKLQH